MQFVNVSTVTNKNGDLVVMNRNGNLIIVDEVAPKTFRNGSEEAVAPR